MDLKDFTLEMMLEYLKNKGMLSGSEQDIFHRYKLWLSIQLIEIILFLKLMKTELNTLTSGSNYHCSQVSNV